MSAGRFVWSFALTLALAGACGEAQRPDYFQPLPEAGAGTGGAFIDAGNLDGPPPADATLCGNQFIPVVVDRPNLYFVIDRSGSMGEKSGGFSYYQHARIAIAEVLRTIGHRVSYGAAVFPTTGGPIEGCQPGKQVFPTQPGDPVTFAEQGTEGPVLESLLATLAAQSPHGGTPTAATLNALASTLSALPGKTFLVLATDGAPNCNGAAQCDESECMLNLEGASVGGVQCQSGFNCCNETLVPGGQLQCVDADASEAAVAALASAGIPTYVVGIPGSEAYSAVLDRLAIAGETARPTSPKYYAVGDASQLSAVLKQIGAKVAISCDIQLDFEPEDPDLVNVYLDKQLLPSDEIDGWVWTGTESVQIRGPACDKLMSGDVLTVQVVGGCPTTVR